MLDWNDLKLFLAVSRAGSTLAAARALGVNQTTVSRRIQALEHALGLALFTRRTTGYALTEPGRALLAAAGAVETAVAATEAEAERLRRLAQGVLRVTAPEMVFAHLLTPIVVAYRAERPELRIEQVSSETRLDLAAGEADIAFRSSEQPIPEDLIARRLPDFGWTAYCSRGYAARHGAPRTPEDLRGHAVVLYDKPLALTNHHRWIVAQVDPARVVARSNTVHNMRGMLQAGMGVGFLPCFAGDSAPDLLRCFDPIPALAGPWWLLMTAEVQRNPAARRFADFAAARLVAQRRFITGQR